MSTPQADRAMDTKTGRVRSPQIDSVSAAAVARRKAIFGGGGLYQARKTIHPKLVHGRSRQIKWAMLIATLIIYYGTPWIRWHRPAGLPQQAILIDFTHARFYAFGIELWPQEVHFITGLLVVSALALFLVTALFGRLWCGYSCPQTIWTDLYIVVERAFEGDRNARMKLDAAPWSLNKAWRKSGKHLVWLLIAFWTGGAWNLYFHDAPTLVRDFWAGTAPVTVYVSFAVLTFTTYTLAGLMREQVCTYMCPWPRIQGALIDEHTLQVTYRRDRGEPRGPHKKADSWEGRGDCIDCQQCVVVCPMGIDIRDGAQLECINCGLCIDACDEVMLKIDRPKGLIAYDTDAAVTGRQSKAKPVYRLIRPRTIFYGAALALVSGLMAWGLANRSPVVFSVLRDRNPASVALRDGSVRDGYTLKLSNRSFESRDFAITVTGLSGATLRTSGSGVPAQTVQIQVPAETSRSVKVFVTAPADEARAQIQPIAFAARSAGRATTDKSAFVSGANHE
jgi:cytochrome c oxidase accessory protein FixG